MVSNVAELISIISYVLNPEVFIIGGGIVKQKDYLLPLFINKTKEKIIPHLADSLNIKIAELENDAGMVGAAYYFIKTYESQI